MQKLPLKGFERGKAICIALRLRCKNQGPLYDLNANDIWCEFLRAGFNAQDLKRVLSYLQNEIRSQRRNIGALKLSNLLQLDRFEEDLNISRVRLRPPTPPPKPTLQQPPEPEVDDQQRHKIRQQLRIFRQQLGRKNSAS